VTGVRIVDAVAGDADAIFALQRLAYESEARRYDNWSIPPLVETLDSVRAHIETHAVLKAVDGARIVGSVRGVVTDRVCEVGRLIVHPERQRRGIGSALLDAIERRVPDVDAFELFTGDRSVENLRLYERHGYRRVRTEPVSPAVSLVFLRKAAHAARS
jgi:ribosomal protein S18 acetylase RimI-like enzyme